VETEEREKNMCMYVYNTVLNLKKLEQVEIIYSADYNSANVAFCGTCFDSVLRYGIIIKMVE
jgi:hypothetical protein